MITWRNEALTIINCYVAPKNAILDTLATIENVKLRIGNDLLIVAGDFSAKNHLWGGNNTDERGRALYEFSIKNNL